MRINKMLGAILFIAFLWSNALSVMADDTSILRGTVNSGDRKQVSTHTPDQGTLLRSIQGAGLFENITQISLEGINTSFSGNLMTLHNVRIDSATTSLNDYISIDFLLDVASLRLVPVSTEVIPDLGIYYREENFFSKDVSADIVITTSDESTLAVDQVHNITATSTEAFTMELEVGTVFSLQLFDPSDDYQIQIISPDGSHFSSNLFSKGSRWTWGPQTVLKAGMYTFQFLPENDSSVDLQFGFLNNNSAVLRELVSGSTIFNSLNQNSYAKYRIQLKKGDLLTVTKPSAENIYLNLLNSNGDSLRQVAKGELFIKIPKAGDYYLFVQNKDFANSASYSGQVTIAPDPDIAQYPTLSTIATQSIETGKEYTLQIQATAANKYTATGLPPSLSINETTGVISGTPLVSGQFPVKLNVENDFGSDESFFLLTIMGDDAPIIPSAGVVSIAEDLSIHIPHAIYPSVFENLPLWINFVFVPQEDGRLMWELSDFGEVN